MADFFDVTDARELHDRSPIARYFYEKSVLLTGASGFLGQLYLEKLLRIGVKDVYILLRPKKNVQPVQRIQQIISSPVFDRLRKTSSNIEHRIKVIAGNLATHNLGIKPDDIAELNANINIIIHSGADVRFDISLPEQILINVRGTKCLLEMATKMTKLQQFTYISTAYSHCTRANIAEQFYPIPIDPHFLIKLTEKWIRDDNNGNVFDIITAKLIYPWPNNYTFTKAMSEELVRQYGNKYSTLIVRPSIIISTHEDPIVGWTNNLSGLNGIMLGIGIGFLRNLKIDANIPMENVCGDYVTNGTLAAIWHENLAKPVEAKIVHITHKGRNLKVGNYLKKGVPLMTKERLYSIKCIWYPVFRLSTYSLENFIVNILYHIVPSFLMDLFNSNKDIRLMKIARKSESLLQSFKYFINKPLHFENTKMNEIQERMTEADKKLFPSDTRNIDLLAFLPAFFIGMRLYVIKDPIETLDESLKKREIQKLIHYTLKYTIWTLLIIFLYLIIW